MKDERIKSELTKALYEDDGSIFECEATVLVCEEIIDEATGNKSYAIILNQTVFFPEGGGQQADEGIIVLEGGQEIKVTDVQTDDNGRILHFVNVSIHVEANVIARLDKDTRLSRMQNHSGEHLLSGLINKIYGYENVGFHMLDVGARFDCSGPLTNEQIQELELLANRAIYENVPITISYPTSEEAKLIDYRRKLDIEEGIRLVTIEGYDICACCAPHLKSTGQIGIIKIIDAMPHRGGMRITMVAGLDAYRDYVMLHDDNSKIMALLSSKRDTTAQFSQDFFDRNQKLKEEYSNHKKEMVNILSESVISKIKNRDENDNPCELIFTDVLDNVGLRNLINSCTEMFSGIVAGFIGDDANGYRYIMATSGDRDIIAINKQLTEKLSGRGGGNKEMVQGSVSSDREAINQFFEELEL